MRHFSYIFLIVFSFWILNCTAAEEKEKHRISIQRVGDGLTLGVLITELNEKDKEKLKVEAGAKVVDVIEESAAEEAGVKRNDVIISFEGEDIETAKQLNKIVEEMDEGKDVTFKVLREGKEVSFNATLREMENKSYSYAFSDEGEEGDFTWYFSDDEEDSDSWFADDGVENEIIVDNIQTSPMRIFENGSDKGAFLGIEGKNISDQLKEYFETEHGVLIEKVLKDTPAEKAALKAGDVITFIEGRKIEDYSDLIRTLNYYNPEEKVEIQYVRKGAEKNVDVTLAKKKGNKLFINKDGDNTFIKSGSGPAFKIREEIKDFDHHPFEGIKRNFYII